MKPNTENKSKRAKWPWGAAIFALLILSAVLGLVIADYHYLLYGGRGDVGEKTTKTEKKEIKCAGCVRRRIDGVYVPPEEENLRPLAVIIENHPAARPQFALAKANLVYEAETEGGITRFLAVFADGKDIEKIGPIRSARPYFVGWARSLSALFVHSGGSPAALAMIARENMLDFNEFYNGQYFWRDDAKEPPHNLFTSTAKLRSYLKKREKEQGNFLSWRFRDDKNFFQESIENKKNIVPEIAIGFKSPDFAVKWKYDPRNNDYLRFMGGKTHKDADGREIRAKNVAVMRVKAEVIDEKLRLKMNYVGKGEAIVCSGGKCEKGEWRKPDNASRVRFYEENGGEFAFNAGTTWLEIVRSDTKITIYP